VHESQDLAVEHLTPVKEIPCFRLFLTASFYDGLRVRQDRGLVKPIPDNSRIPIFEICDLLRVKRARAFPKAIHIIFDFQHEIVKLIALGLLIILRDAFQLAKQVSVTDRMVTWTPEIRSPEIMNHITFEPRKDLHIIRSIFSPFLVVTVPH
jgi:hypothetical protein